MKTITSIEEINTNMSDEQTLHRLLNETYDFNTNKIIKKLNVNTLDEALDKCMDKLNTLKEIKKGYNHLTTLYFKIFENELGCSVERNAYNYNLRYKFKNKYDKLKIIFYLAYRNSLTMKDLCYLSDML